jgi:hypothetical protein
MSYHELREALQEVAQLKYAAQYDYAEGWNDGVDSVIDKLHRAHKLIDAIRGIARAETWSHRIEEIKRLITDYETEQEESLKVLEGE